MPRWPVVALVLSALVPLRTRTNTSRVLATTGRPRIWIYLAFARSAIWDVGLFVPETYCVGAHTHLTRNGARRVIQYPYTSTNRPVSKVCTRPSPRCARRARSPRKESLVSFSHSALSAIGHRPVTISADSERTHAPWRHTYQYSCIGMSRTHARPVATDVSMFMIMYWDDHAFGTTTTMGMPPARHWHRHRHWHWRWFRYAHRTGAHRAADARRRRHRRN